MTSSGTAYSDEAIVTTSDTGHHRVSLKAVALGCTRPWSAGVPSAKKAPSIDDGRELESAMAINRNEGMSAQCTAVRPIAPRPPQLSSRSSSITGQRTQYSPRTNPVLIVPLVRLTKASRKLAEKNKNAAGTAAARVTFFGRQQLLKKQQLRQFTEMMEHRITEQREAKVKACCNIIGTWFLRCKERQREKEEWLRKARQEASGAVHRLRRRVVLGRFRGAARKVIRQLHSASIYNAATKIQACWRGFRLRHNGLLGSLRAASAAASTAVRAWEGQRHAAHIVQSAWIAKRMRDARRAFVVTRLNARARVIQRCLRSWMYRRSCEARATAFDELCAAAAKVIQRRWRSHRATFERRVMRFCQKNFPKVYNQK